MRGNPLTCPRNPKEAKERIEEWLKEEGFSCSLLLGDEGKNSLFNYLVSLPSGFRMNVVQPSNKKDLIFVLSRLLFTPEQNKLFLQKTSVERDEILADMRFKLAALDVDFSFEDGKSPRSIKVLHPIYYDALTKDRFFRGINIVFKALKKRVYG
jgi:hypothetical protein